VHDDAAHRDPRRETELLLDRVDLEEAVRNFVPMEVHQIIVRSGNFRRKFVVGARACCDGRDVLLCPG